MTRASSEATALVFQCVFFAVSFLVLLLQTAQAQQLNLYEGSACRLPSGIGVCSRVSDCPRALHQLRGGRRRNPVICSFLGSAARPDLAIVCCPSAPVQPPQPLPLAVTSSVTQRPTARPVLKTTAKPKVRPTLKTTVKPLVVRPVLKTTVKPEVRPALMTTVKPVVGGGNGTGIVMPTLGNRMTGGEKARKACDDLTNEIQLEPIPLIFDGVNTVEGEFPHMALLGFLPRGGGALAWNCGGTLISHLYVLTAAHCLRTKTQGSPVRVRLGEYDLAEDNSHRVDYGVGEIIVHPEYKATTWYNDIGLIRLDRPAQFTAYIHPACLYTKSEEPAKGLIITGWGATTHNGGGKATVLQKGKSTLSPVAASICLGFYKGAGQRIALGIQDGMFCAADPLGSVDTCQGDSGGPIQLEVETTHATVFSVVGVTSGGPGLCGGRTPAIYTRVYNYLPWIEGIVWK